MTPTPSDSLKNRPAPGPADRGSVRSDSVLPLCGARLSDPIELRLLLVTEVAVELVERAAHGLYCPEHDVEPFCYRRKPGRRGCRQFGWAGGGKLLRRLRSRALQSLELRLLRLVRPQRRFDPGLRPLDCSIRRGAVLCQPALPPGLSSGRLIGRVELRPLLVRQGAIEPLKRHTYYIDRLFHGFDPLLHGGKPPCWRECDRGRAAGLDDLGCLHGGVGKIIERRALLIIRRHQLLDAIDRPAGHFLGVVPAHLSERSGRRRAIRPRAAPGRQISGEVVKGERREQPAIDVAIAVIPERIAVADAPVWVGAAVAPIAPEDVAIDVAIRVRPEQRTDPAEHRKATEVPEAIMRES